MTTLTGWVSLLKKKKMKGNLRIYGDIGYYWYDGVENTANALVAKIEELSADCSEIVVHINSVGGDIYDGLPIFNALKHCGIPVHTVVDGCAMSMAGIIFQAGTRRSMCRSSVLHIHAPEGFEYGNAVALRQAADELDAWATPLIAAIAAKCGKTADEVRALWFDGKDHYFNPDEALAAGLIDDVYDADAQFPEGIAPENITNMAARDIRDIYARAYNKQEKGQRLFGLIPIKNSKKTKTPKNDMDTKKLCAKLGLKPGASEKEILDAIDRRKTPKNEAGSDEQTKPEEEKDVEQQVEEAQQTAEEAQTTAEEAQQTAEETQEELEELKEKVETLEQEKEALTEELAAYKNKSNRGGGAPARSDFKNTARNVKDEWGYIKGNIFD